MKPQMRPGIPLPAPLKGAETGSFAHNTIVVRLPDIARRALGEYSYPPAIRARLEDLIAEIPGGPVRPLLDPGAPDLEDWARYVDPYQGLDWLEVPWFFAETYFYRRILEATGYFQVGSWRGVDPFAAEKRRGLETMLAAVHALGKRLERWLQTAGPSREALTDLLEAALWGNQADLSLWPAGQGGRPPRAGAQLRQAYTLVDDGAAVVARLFDRVGKGSRIDFIMDNAAFELVCDLCLVDYLLSAGVATHLVLHLKSHPTFVSDAMIPDVRSAVAFLAGRPEGEIRRLGARLQAHLDANRLHLQEDTFWTSPLSLWEMPPALGRDLAQADLVISKGDANYRRLLGDRHWPFTTPFAEIVAYFPAPLVALRTLKSEVAAGLAPEQLQELDRVDPTWLTDGKWGMIQYADRR